MTDITPTSPMGDSAVTEANMLEALTDLLASELGDTYSCTRVWSAWGYGTMTQDDFEPAEERAGEIADSILRALPALAAALSARPAQEPVAINPDMLRLSVAAVLEADKEFRAQMPAGWDGDPLTDELDGLRRVFETQPALSSQRGEDSSTPSPDDGLGVIETQNDEAGFVEFINSDVPYIVRDIPGPAAILLDMETRQVIGYRVYDPARATTISSLEARIEALREAMNAVCSGCRDGHPVNDHGYHCGGAGYTYPCHATAIRALSKGTGHDTV